MNVEATILLDATSAWLALGQGDQQQVVLSLCVFEILLFISVLKNGKFIIHDNMTILEV